MLTCSSGSPGGRSRTRAVPCAAAASSRRPTTPMHPTYAKCSSSRNASPSAVWYSSRKWPPQLSLRCSASRHISSPNSRKSATRPAFSSDWLSDWSSPSTRTFFQNSSRIAGISEIAFSRLCSVRAMPQLSQSTLPSSRWMSSTLRVPLIESSCLVLSRTCCSAAWNTASSVLGAGGTEQRREVVVDRGRDHEVAVGESLHQRRRAEAVRAVVGEVRLTEHVQTRAGCSSGCSRPRARPSCSARRDRCASGTCTGPRR